MPPYGVESSVAGPCYCREQRPGSCASLPSAAAASTAKGIEYSLLPALSCGLRLPSGPDPAQS